MARFTERIVVVTGAGSGIGQATARGFAAEEGHVACVDLDEAAAKQTVGEIEASGGSAAAYACDVADPDRVRAAIASVAAELGAPHVLCNVAGIGNFAHTTELSIDDWQRVIAVNLTRTFLVCQATIPHLLERGGNIVDTASNAGFRGLAYAAAYCASKGGVVQLTRALAME
jgi:NAD(P)-dependent dehydrogenase (short-subunit alcohol dehydrogenase family)